MRLIDAGVENERLLDFIVQHAIGIQNAIACKDMTMLKDIFFDYFKSQKTAYDLESVIEQLEKLIEETYYKSATGSYCEGVENNAFHKCLEIVKSGTTATNGG